MYRALLVPLDGSDFAEDAIPLASVLAAKLDAEVHFAHVIRPAYDFNFKMPQDDFAWKEKIWDGATAYLEDRADEVRSEGVSALTAVLEGRVPAALGTYSEEQEIDLTVLTTHGSGGVRRWWLGSVADALLRGGKTDLLLVRPWDDTEDRERSVSRFERILVPLDGSDTGEAALGRTLDLAAQFGASVKLVRVVPKPIELRSIYGGHGLELSGHTHDVQVQEARDYLNEVAGRYPDTPLEAEVVESDSAADGVVEVVRGWDADLIGLSSHGRTGIERAFLGSVADKIIRATTRPVLVVRAFS
jgi:nucleotide-binding universal stress UspA family protein